MPAGAVLIFPAALMAVSHVLLALFPSFAVLLVGTVGSTVAYGGITGEQRCRTTIELTSIVSLAFWAGFNYLLSSYFGDKYLGQNLGAIALGAVRDLLFKNTFLQ